MAEELTVHDVISSIRSYYEKEIATLRAQLAEALASERERAAKVADKWVADLVAAGDQFDSDGDIYRIADVVQDVAARIRALSPTPNQEKPE